MFPATTSSSDRKELVALVEFLWPSPILPLTLPLLPRKSGDSRPKEAVTPIFSAWLSLEKCEAPSKYRNISDWLACESVLNLSCLLFRGRAYHRVVRIRDPQRIYNLCFTRFFGNMHRTIATIAISHIYSWIVCGSTLAFSVPGTCLLWVLPFRVIWIMSSIILFYWFKKGLNTARSSTKRTMWL